MIRVFAVDPTHTVTLRNRYATAIRQRFAAVKVLIHRTVVENDAFGIGLPRPRMKLLQVLPVHRFPFPTDAQKVEAFMDWLGEAIDEKILEVTRREGRRIVAHKAWQDVYVRSAYEAGILSAHSALARAGVDVTPTAMWAVFNAPRHADALGLLYTRNFAELRGITNAMSQAISRSLASGLAEGMGPREIGRMLADDVAGIGVARGTLLARTEVIRCFAEATLNRFEDYGIDQVEGEVEFLATRDDRVCDICKATTGDRFTIDEARGVIPVHPNCRCAWKPVVPDPAAVTRTRVAFPVTA